MMETFLFIVGVGIGSILLQLVRFINKKVDPRLNDPDWDPLAEMMAPKPGAEPVDIQQVIEYLTKIAGSLENWKDIGGGDWEHSSGFVCDPKMIFWVKFKGEKVKFLKEEDWRPIRLIFLKTIKDRKDWELQEGARQQLAEFSKAIKS